MSSLVATVDLNDADAGARIADSLGASGFVCVTGHGVADGLLDRAYATAARLFALPEAAKKACEDPASGRQRGYTPYLLEQAKDHDTPDLKEFCLFREMTRDGDSILRVIHYPPLPEGAPPNAVRAAAHGDINLMTVLPASTAPGLELLTREGAWEPVVPPPGAMILDTGDMMARITGNRLPATIHRVVNPDDAGAGARYSIPFFLHPHPDAILAPLTEDAEPAIVAREFLDERLRAIGVL
jgi:isopenicillin N synthase-like dioxygenase